MGLWNHEIMDVFPVWIRYLFLALATVVADRGVMAERGFFAALKTGKEKGDDPENGG